MNNKEKAYIILCILFVTILVLANLIYQKFVTLPLPFYRFELSVGTMLYPATFLATDLITEFYGKQRAQFCIRSALLINTLVVLIIAFMDYLPATPWSKLDDQTFHTVFGYCALPFVASTIACYTAQAIDVRLYLLIRRLTKGKYLWLRSNGSTCLSLLLDTSIVIGFMTAFGVLPQEKMGSLIANSYSWKLFFTLCSTPLFYMAVSLMKWFINLTPTEKR